MSKPTYRLMVDDGTFVARRGPLPKLLDECRALLAEGAASVRLERLSDGALVLAVDRHAHAPRDSWLRS